MLRLLSRAGIALAIAVAGVSGVAGAQGTVDYATRTVTAKATATYPNGVNPRVTASAFIQGTLDTRLLARSQTQYILFHLYINSVSATASDFTSTAGSPDVVEANVRFNSREYEQARTPNNLGDGTYDLGPGLNDIQASTFIFGQNVDYGLSAGAFVNLYDQGPGATGTGTANATLLGADAYSTQGVVTSSAVFDDFGNGIFATSTPEPSSLALLGTGLVGLIPLMRRRKRSVKS